MTKPKGWLLAASLLIATTAHGQSPATLPHIAFVGATATTVTVQVTAGSGGAPQGFDIVWEDQNQIMQCSTSFSCRHHRLHPYSSVTVTVPIPDNPNRQCRYSDAACLEPLPCGTMFNIWMMIHGGQTSNPTICMTDSCP